MKGEEAVNVAAVVGEAPLRVLPLVVLSLAFMVIAIDGYNYLCVSFAAPALAVALGIPVASFGTVYVAGYLGVFVGGLVIGPVCDRIGRKVVLLASVGAFGVCSLLPIVDWSYSHLLVYRFLTGVGLGGAMPSAVAITAEYAPRRFRGLFVNLMFAGFATGGVIGGFLAAQLIPQYGWQAAFWIGGLAPLILVPVLWAFMPESIAYLAAAGKRPEYIARTLQRIDGTKVYRPDDRYVPGEGSQQSRGRIPELLSAGRRPGTLLLWLVTFCALFSWGLVVSWLPAIMTGVGFPVRTGIVGAVLLNLGGLGGTILLGMLFSRVGASTLIAISMLLAAGALLMLGYDLQSQGAVRPPTLIILWAGACMVGSINSVNALMAAFYPITIRATGVGWALGMGRIGGIIGPYLGGAMLAAKAPVAALFWVPALLSGIGSCAIVGIGFLYPQFRRSARLT